MAPPLRIAYVIDPRFPGGTSSAVAMELREMVQLGRVSVHGVSSAMFPGHPVAPVLDLALKELGLALTWDDAQVEADLVIVHNPSFLKRQKALKMRIIARQMVAVTHESFLRPGGIEAFDVRHCLEVLERASLVLKRSLAPISVSNRVSVTDWLALHPQPGWTVLAEDWFNICEFELRAPTQAPADRRGRHSRPGFEKFPDMAVMDASFPPHAEANVILGADMYLKEDVNRPHWQLHPFQGLGLEEYFERIDFMVYYTAPTWQESFGRVVAESLAAGKVVITDAGLAGQFAGAVVPAPPDQINRVIARYVKEPHRYADQVRRGQEWLPRYSGRAFRQQLSGLMGKASGAFA